MANTYVDYTATAAQQYFAFNFPYLEDEHVVVEIEGVDQTITTNYTIETSPSQRINLSNPTTALAGGELVRIKRRSAPNTNLVDFQNGSVLTEAELDRAYLHNRYLAEEATEGADSGLKELEGSANYNAGNKQIKNLADGTLATDAVNKGYVDTQIALTDTNLAGFYKSTHTGNAVDNVFTLSFTPQTTDAKAYIVSIDGLVQVPDTDYTIGATAITFNTIPPNSAEICVVATAAASVATVNQAQVTALGTTTARSLENRFGDVVNVLDYGADNTGATDSRMAIKNALTASVGKVLVFPTGTYSISDVIDFTATDDIYIRGEDSVLLLESSSVIQDAVFIQINDNNLTINDLKVDANNKAHRALHIRNESNTNVKNTTLNKVSTVNVYRSSQAFIGGDGILIRGGFERVVLNQPYVKGVKMATGAGISGSEGVFGITVTKNFAGTLAAKHVVINDPHIEDIYSEDNTYTQDQDGMRLFGLPPTSTEIPEGSCFVKGGCFINCWGRSIKVQRQDAKIVGSYFFRDAGFNTGYGNTEIDFQYGSGQVSNITCSYHNFNPTIIVNSTAYDAKQSGFIVNGVNVELNNTTLTAGVQRFRPSGTQKGSPLFVRNVNLFGNAEYLVNYDTNVSTATDGAEYAKIDNCFCENLSSGLMRFRGNANTNKVFINNCSDGNAGGLPLVVDGVTGNVAYVQLTGQGNVGFAESFSGQGSLGSRNQVIRLKQAMADTDGVDVSGILGLQHKSVADDETVTFDAVGVDGRGYGLYFVTVNYEACNAIIAGPIGNPTNLSVIYDGPSIVVGTTGTNPDTDGYLNLWLENGQIKVKNRLGSTRNVSLMAYAS